MTLFTRPAPRLLTPHEQRRREQRDILEAQRRDPDPLPDQVVDVLKLRSQVAQMADDDFRALVVAEAGRRGLVGMWRELP